MPTDKDILDCKKELDEVPVLIDNRMAWFEGELYTNESGKWEKVDATE